MTRPVILIGVNHLREVLGRLGEEADEELGKELYDEALEAFAESQRQVPRDTGVLANSGQVGEPEHHGHETTVDISYGGAASAYALIVHENLDANHPHGGKAKYLEDPVNDRVDGMAERIATRLEERLA